MNENRNTYTLPRLPEGELILKEGSYYLLYKGAEYRISKANPDNLYYLDYMAEQQIKSIEREKKLALWN